MKKLLILLFSILLMGGCFDYVEIDDLVIVSGMLIDYENNQFKVTSQVIENESKSKVRVFTTKADTIEECISQMSKLSNKDIFMSHLKVLILTDEIIKNDINYYDYFLRDAKSKMNFYVYRVDDENKDKVLSIYKDSEGSSLYLKDMMDFNNRIFSSSTPVSFLDLMYKKIEYGLEPIYPNLLVKKNNGEKVLYLENLVIFKDKKTIILDDNQGIFYNIATNNIEKRVINIPCEEDNFSISFTSVKTEYKWNKNTFNINTSLGGKISSYSCKFDLNNNQTITKLNKIANNYIKDKIYEIIDLSKDNNIDFIGIGNFIYKHDMNYFDFKNNDWNNNLKNINVKVNTKTKINSIGEKRK